MRRRSSWILVSSLAALTAAVAIAALAAVPPNLAKAIEAQRRLTVERPQDPAVFNDFGNLLMLVPQAPEAEAAYRKAIELDPDKASALFNLGLLLQQRGERREAYDLYQRAVKADPNHAWAHYQLGTIEEVRGQKSKAVDSYARAFALDPQLAFPEVNPHIVDNKLVTQAMLRAYKNDFAGNPQVPKMYDDAARIAALLVPKPAPPVDETAAAPNQQRQPASRQPVAGRGQRRRLHRRRREPGAPCCARGISTAATPPARPVRLAAACARRPASRGSAGCASGTVRSRRSRRCPEATTRMATSRAGHHPFARRRLLPPGDPEHRPAEPADRSGSGGPAVGRRKQGT